MGRRAERGLICAALVQGKTALRRAAENGDETFVRQLIAARANPDAKDVINRACARVSHFQSAQHFPRLA